MQGESVSERLGDILADALREEIPIFMSVVNVGEIWYILARKVSAGEADTSVSTLGSWGIVFVDADWSLTREAAALKSRFKISYADAFAAALAKTRRAELVTGDPEFEPLREYIRIRRMR